MKNRLLGFVVRQAHHPEQSRRAALGFLLIAFVLAFAPVVRAQGVDDKIQALENELGRLKSEQMELKKEAVAAAAAMPDFSWRPRSGVTIAAADRSWSITTFLQGQFHMYNYPNADDRGGFSTGDIHTRRFRPGWTLCVMNCLYEWHQTWDIDTGNIGNNQNMGLYMRFSKINPWLPDILVADEESLIAHTYVNRSSTSSARIELANNLLTDSNTDTESRRHIGLGWQNKPLLFAPGTGDLVLEYRVGGGMTENVVTDTDRKQFVGTIGGSPFSRSKNPYIERLRLGMTAAISPLDSRSAVQGRSMRIRTDERQNRLSLLNANGIGDGTSHNLMGGIEWGYGPYTAIVEWGVSKYHSGKAGGTLQGGFMNAHGGRFSIAHDVFLWSPKGLFTGGAYQPGTVQFGWQFARAAANCGGSGITARDCDPSNADFNNIRLLKRELDIWYYWNTFSRIGLFWNWWDADNMPRNLQADLNCSSNTQVATGLTAGKGCDWHSVNLALQVYF